MRVAFFKGIVIGALIAAGVVIAGRAVAGTGVGAVFNLGQGNSVNSTSLLTGTTPGAMLNITNGDTGSSAYAIAANNKSIAAPAFGGGNSGTGPGVRGVSSGGDGVVGSGSTAGVRGSSGSGRGVVGSGGSTNLLGLGFGADRGVEGQGADFGVIGFVAAGGTAGYFDGNATVTGNLNVGGTLTKGGGAFKIDHPLDPAHAYLQHSFVESPDMMDVYNGNTTTNENGFATVSLPSYFQALNRDFRYQLTVIASPSGNFAQAMVVEKIAENRFTLRTSEANVEVSWQVTGIRHDAYANAHRIKIVVAKHGKEIGTYLDPGLYGKSASRSLTAVSGPKPAPSRP